MFKFSILAFSIFFAFSMYSQVPSHIKTKADSILKAKVGDEVFVAIQQYCLGSGPVLANSVWKSCDDTLRMINRRRQQMISEIWNNNKIAYYRFEYELIITPRVQYYFTIDIDTSGTLVADRPVLLPDCASDPSLCSKLLDENEAFQIAEKVNFPNGVKGWDINFVFDESRGRFFWEIRNYSSYKKHYAGCEDAEGEMLKIDSAKGTVFSGKAWKLYCSK